MGGHLSLNGKPRATVQWAAEHGFRSMQIFASSPGAWKPPVIYPERDADFLQARREYQIEPLVIHAIYLINLASANPVLVERSKESLIRTMQAGANLGATGVITHIGSHGGRGFEAVADQVASAIVEILARTPPEVLLILENSAGAGAIIGSTITELGAIVDRAGHPPRLGVALDTAHLCASGWDFADAPTACRLVSEVDGLFGLDRLIVVHGNDSARPCGSHRDRHANIGKGFVGLEGFRHLLAQPALRAVPWILETPDLEERVTDRITLQALASEPLISGAKCDS